MALREPRLASPAPGDLWSGYEASGHGSSLEPEWREPSDKNDQGHDPEGGGTMGNRIAGSAGGLSQLLRTGATAT